MDSWCHYFGVLFGVYYTLSDPLEKVSMSGVKITGINKREVILQFFFFNASCKKPQGVGIEEFCRLPLVLYVSLDSF